MDGYNHPRKQQHHHFVPSSPQPAEEAQQSAMIASIPVWACYAFAISFLLIILLLLLDYLLIRRNALGTNCFTLVSRRKNGGTNAGTGETSCGGGGGSASVNSHNYKRTTNMIISV